MYVSYVARKINYLPKKLKTNLIEKIKFGLSVNYSRLLRSENIFEYFRRFSAVLKC